MTDNKKTTARPQKKSTEETVTEEFAAMIERYQRELNKIIQKTKEAQERRKANP